MKMRRFKKIFAVLLALFMLAAAQPCTYAENSIPEIRVLSTVSESRNVNVRLWLSNNTGLVTLRLNVEYDSDKLILDSVTDGGILGECYHSDSLISPYTLYWANDIVSENFTTDGVIAELCFTVTDKVAVGEEITVTPVFESGEYNAFDKEINSLKINVFSGAVTVQNAVPFLETPFLHNSVGNTITVSGVEKDITEINIKPVYNANGKDYAVNEISDYAFADCSKLQSVTLPEGISSIGNGAFLNCTALASLDIPDSVEYIGQKAFYGCDNTEFYCFPYTKAHTAIKNTGVDYILYGDLCLDYEINSDDLALMKKVLLNELMQEKSADVTRSGNINILDFIKLKILCS